MKFQKLSKEKFVSLLDYLNITENVCIDFVYDVYSIACDKIQVLIDNNIIDNLDAVSNIEIVFYTAGEYVYSVAGRNAEATDLFNKNDEIKQAMAGVVADKYVSLALFSFKEKKIASKYLPPMSSLDLFLNFMLNILNSYEKNDPKTTLITDLMIKSISLCSCVLHLLTLGHETEAFAVWRTLHECECTVIILEHFGDPLIEVYLKHMKYGIAFKDEIEDKAVQDQVFVELKAEMKSYGLKSKDMKKYIEYGWLYGIPGVKESETFRLNFRDGLEMIAGLNKYSKRYEISSEIIHSTPMLYYANKQYYYYLTLLSLYESFFRLEKVFVSIYTKRVGPETIKKYNELRKIYYTQLVNIHKREVTAFTLWQKKNKGKIF